MTGSGSCIPLSLSNVFRLFHCRPLRVLAECIAVLPEPGCCLTSQGGENNSQFDVLLGFVLSAICLVVVAILY